MGKKSVALTDVQMVGTLAEEKVEKLVAQSVAEKVERLAGLKVAQKDDLTAAMTVVKWVAHLVDKMVG
jgi:hypothetical protein